MTPERAKYILANRLMGGDFRYAFRERVGSQYTYPDGITTAEYHDIQALWQTMPGNTCFESAVVRIARRR